MCNNTLSPAYRRRLKGAFGSEGADLTSQPLSTGLEQRGYTTTRVLVRRTLWCIDACNIYIFTTVSLCLKKEGPHGSAHAMGWSIGRKSCLFSFFAGEMRYAYLPFGGIGGLWGNHPRGKMWWPYPLKPQRHSMFFFFYGNPAWNSTVPLYLRRCVCCLDYSGQRQFYRYTSIRGISELTNLLSPASKGTFLFLLKTKNQRFALTRT